MPLYHYTCDHGRAQIDDTLIPGRDQLPDGDPRRDLASPFVWLTDLTVPVRDALGLTMNAIACDRTAHRYRVTQPDACHPWTAVRRMLGREYVDLLESAPGARPAHWWVSGVPVPVVLDPIGGR